MVGECSICLCAFKDPASIPCGHIFCMDCIYTCVNAQPAGAKATCPVCRKDFNIVAPDLAFLPKKYHEYVLPSLRRVYFDERPSEELESLKSQLAITESNLQRSEIQQKQLHVQIDHWKNAAGQASRQEAQVREQLRVNQGLVNQWSQSHGQLAGQYQQLEVKYRKLEVEHSSMKEKCALLFQRLGLSRPAGSASNLSSPIDRQPIAQQAGLPPMQQYYHHALFQNNALPTGGGSTSVAQQTCGPPHMFVRGSPQPVMNQTQPTGVKRNSQVAFDDFADTFTTPPVPAKRPCMPGPS